MKPATFAGAFVALVLLAACGGGDDAASDTAGQTEWTAEVVEDYPYPVQMFENEAPSAEGRHFAQGEFPGYNTVQYGTDPPTSGKHIGQLAQVGVYDEPVPNEVAVHQMEHGYTMVWYNCDAEEPLAAAECTDLRNELSSIVQPAVAEGYHVVMTPDATMEHRLAVTAWQFMDTMDEVDTERLRTFVETFECHYDPEGTCN
jgi:hypothetical protein